MTEVAIRTSPLRGRPGERINQELLGPVLKTGARWWFLTTLMAVGAGCGFAAWLWQINHGMTVAGINSPVNWSFYIINFVFWVGISHSGTMISAILRLTKAEWRYPITRAAEAMTIFSLVMAQLFPLIHLGRTWLFWYLIPAPWGRGLWPNFRSPLLWDGVAIFTYMTSSSLFLYLATIPDLATYRDRVSGWRRHVYALLSLGWRGTHQQWRWFQRASLIITVLIIPVFVSVHTIVSWDFGMSVVPGWHSTIFAPYFVIGAILSGVSAVVTLMVLLRWALHLEDYITPFHFDQLGKMLLGVSCLWTFMFATETLTVWFAAEASEQPGLVARTVGQFWPLFAVMLLVNFVIPVWYLSSRRRRRSIAGLFVVTLLINVGMWIERFLIIVPSLAHKGTPFSWGSYAPTWVEITMTVGAFCGFTLLYLLFIKAVPLLPVWEIKEGEHVLSYRRDGALEIPERLAPIAEPGWPAPTIEQVAHPRKEDEHTARPGEAAALATGSPPPNRSPRLFRALLAASSGILLAISAYGWLHLGSAVSLTAVLGQYLFWLGGCVGALMIVSIARLTRAEWRRPFARSAELLLLGGLLLLLFLPLLWLTKSRYLDLGLVVETGRWPGLAPRVSWMVDIACATLLAVPAVYVLLQSFRLEGLGERAQHAAGNARSRLKTGSGLFIAGAFVGLAGLGWSFGMNLVPHWHSTLFAAAYVGESLQIGAALLLVLALSLRRVCGLEDLTSHHVDQLGKFLVALALFWFYFRFADFLTGWYGNLPHETAILASQFWHESPTLFLTSFALTFLIPLLYFSIPAGRRYLPGAFLVAVGILLGGALERLQIFSSVHPDFGASITTWGIGYALLAALAFPATVGLAIALGLTFLSPFATWEIMDGRRMRSARRVGGTIIATYALVEPEDMSHG